MLIKLCIYLHIFMIKLKNNGNDDISKDPCGQVSAKTTVKKIIEIK